MRLIVDTSESAEEASGPPTPSLTPAQSKAADELRLSLSAGAVCVLRADAGMGRSSILGTLQDELSASFVAAGQFLKLLRERSPDAIEESFMDAIERAFDEGEVVLVDDLQLITAVVQSYDYARPNLLEAVLTAVLDEAERRRKRLVFATTGTDEPATLRNRAFICEMEEFTEEDFACICRRHLGESADAIDFERLFRFAPALNGHQLRNACAWLTRQPTELSTETFLDYLRSRNLASNVDLEEVEPARWSDLKGLEDIVEELEAKIALPFGNDARALQLNLKPKRGVLLAGPPGTGKTTIGRALAHRLQGKFFLIDGTVNAGDAQFHDQVEKIFEAAKRNAPSVIFIDDADVIFEAGNHGLSRYLLTMMDGLESAHAGQVCVMITAMDTTSLPPALLRSGRVELWLHTRFPDENARETILREKLCALPPPICDVDVKLLARKSSGLSGADLKAIVEEGKLLYAHALVNGNETTPIEKFFLRAIQSALVNRRSYGKRLKGPNDAGRYGFPAA